jgi:hypothetical protein
MLRSYPSLLFLCFSQRDWFVVLHSIGQVILLAITASLSFTRQTPVLRWATTYTGYGRHVTHTPRYNLKAYDTLHMYAGVNAARTAAKAIPAGAPT